MLARLDPRKLDRIWFPLGEQDKAETRAEAERAGLAVAQRAESQEACFLAGDDYRAFLGAARPRRRSAGAIVDEGGRELGEHDGFWRFTPGQRKGIGVVAERPLYVLGSDARDEHRRRRRRASRSRGRTSPPRAPLRRTSTAPTQSSATARPPCAARRRATAAGSTSSSTSPPTASRAGRPPFSTKATPSSAAASSRPAAATKIARNARRRVHVGRPLEARARRLPARRRALVRVPPRASRRNRWAPFCVHKRGGARDPARDQQGRRQRGSRQRAARQGRSDHRQRGRRRGQRRHRSARRQHGRHAPGAEGLRLRRRRELRRLRLQGEARLEARRAGRQGGRGAPGARARRRAAATRRAAHDADADPADAPRARRISATSRISSSAGSASGST